MEQFAVEAEASMLEAAIVATAFEGFRREAELEQRLTHVA